MRVKVEGVPILHWVVSVRGKDQSDEDQISPTVGSTREY